MILECVEFVRKTLGSNLQNLLSVHIDGGNVVSSDLAVLGSIGLSVLKDVLVDKGLVSHSADELELNRNNHSVPQKPCASSEKESTHKQV